MIHLCIGPMYSGKTTRLLALYREKGGVILDYSEEETTQGPMVNHNGDSAPCYPLSKLCNYTGNDDILYINEAQFFPDLLEFVKQHEQKSIYLFGLNGDFQRKPMGQILEVIPLCDTIEKLIGTCKLCTKGSLFSKRITSDQQQYLLDESAYIPLCRDCYLHYKKNV